jgi:hypothetical protein
LIEDCEDSWAEQVVSGCTQSTATGKVGTNCATTATVSVGGTTLIASEAITKDLSAYDGVRWWAKTGAITTAAGDLELHLSQHSNCATPEETLAYPALSVAATWKQCFARLADPSGIASVISVGVYQKTNLADDTFSIDDVEALAEVDGIKSWTIDYTADTLETTDFGSAGIKSYIIAGSSWSGTFEGYKDGAPLSIGSEVYLVLGESNTAYQNWLGKAIITGASASVGNDGVVSYSYTYQGTGALEAPSA